MTLRLGRNPRLDLARLNMAREAMLSPEVDPKARVARFMSLSKDYPPVLALASALGETRSALSRRTGISLSTLAKWDAGSITPRKSMIGKILQGTPVTSEEFIDALLFWREKVRARVQVAIREGRATKQEKEETTGTGDEVKLPHQIPQPAIAEVLVNKEVSVGALLRQEAEEDDWGAL